MEKRFYLGIVIVYFGLNGSSSLETISTSICYGNTHGNFVTISCGDSEVIMVRTVRAMAKLSSTTCPIEETPLSEMGPNCCVEEPEDCGGRYTGSVYKSYYTRCHGKQQCLSLQASWVTLDQAFPHCNASVYLPRTNYMVYEYSCVPRLTVKSPCDGIQTTSTSVYLWNANYPAEMSSGGDNACTCSAEISCDSTIQITAVDFRLQSDSLGQCQQRLVISENGLDTNLTCASNNNFALKTVYTSNSYFITFKLENDLPTNGGNFWIEISGTNSAAELTLSCGPNVQPGLSNVNKPQCGTVNNGNGTDSGGTNGNGTDSSGTNGNGTDSSSSNGNGTDSSGSNGNGTESSSTNGNGTDSSGSNGNGTDISGSNGNGTDSSGSNGNGTESSGSNGNGTDSSDTNNNGTDNSGINGNGTDSSGTNGNGTDSSGSNNNGTEISGSNGNGTDSSGSNGNGTDNSGTNGNGTDSNGTNGSGTDSSGANNNGTDSSGRNGNGTESSGSNGNGTDSSDTNNNGTDSSGINGNGTDSSGSNNNGTDISGSNGNGTDSSGSNGNGTDSSGTNGNGTDSNGTNGNGTDSSGANNNGTDSSGTNGNGTDSSGSNGNGTDTSSTNGNGTDTSSTNGHGTDTSGTNGNETDGTGNNGNGIDGDGSNGDSAGATGKAGDENLDSSTEQSGNSSTVIVMAICGVVAAVVIVVVILIVVKRKAIKERLCPSKIDNESKMTDPPPTPPLYDTMPNPLFSNGALPVISGIAAVGTQFPGGGFVGRKQQLEPLDLLPVPAHLMGTGVNTKQTLSMPNTHGVKKSQLPPIVGSSNKPPKLALLNLIMEEQAMNQLPGRKEMDTGGYAHTILKVSSDNLVEKESKKERRSRKKKKKLIDRLTRVNGNADNTNC